jgi:hypothetical protein
LLYFNLFFRQFIKEKKFINWKKKKMKKGVANLLTYFFLRYKKRHKNAKRIKRLKKIHWAFPKYIFFDVSTLRAMLLFVPVSKQIYYPFKTSIKKIAFFYKSLAL